MQLSEAQILQQPCGHCGARSWERLQRLGFVQERILPFLGLYPWRCAICNRVRYLKLRADPRLNESPLRATVSTTSPNRRTLRG